MVSRLLLLVRRSLHISQAAHDNSCLVPAQGQACDYTQYVMRKDQGEGGGGVIAHGENRLPMTRSGCGLLLTGLGPFSAAWPWPSLVWVCAQSTTTLLGFPATLLGARQPACPPRKNWGSI